MKANFTFTTAAEVRAAFWAVNPDLDEQSRKAKTRSKGQNAQHAEIRFAWVDFVESLERNCDISPALAQRVTLG